MAALTMDRDERDCLVKFISYIVDGYSPLSIDGESGPEVLPLLRVWEELGWDSPGDHETYSIECMEGEELRRLLHKVANHSAEYFVDDVKEMLRFQRDDVHPDWYGADETLEDARARVNSTAATGQRDVELLDRVVQRFHGRDPSEAVPA